MAHSFDQLSQFMAAIRLHESGNNYTARGPVITNPNSRYYGERAYGAYQIMPGNWPSWSAQAGIPGADWRDPAAQDRVARYKITEYWNRYRDWRLVALAWWAGPGTSDKVVRNGWGAVQYLSDGNQTTPRYVQGVMDKMGMNLDTSLNDATLAENPEIPADEPEQLSSQQIMGMMFSHMADMIAGGKRATVNDIIAARDEGVQDAGATEGALGGIDLAAQFEGFPEEPADEPTEDDRSWWARFGGRNKPQ